MICLLALLLSQRCHHWWSETDTVGIDRRNCLRHLPIVTSAGVRLSMIEVLAYRKMSLLLVLYSAVQSRPPTIARSNIIYTGREMSRNG
jgi:hypothetical protein